MNCVTLSAEAAPILTMIVRAFLKCADSFRAWRTPGIVHSRNAPAAKLEKTLRFASIPHNIFGKSAGFDQANTRIFLML